MTISLRILLFVVLTGCCAAVHAQQLRTGVFTGLNIASLETKPTDTRAEEFSFSMPFGIMVSKHFSKWYGMQAELNYVRMGERINGMQQLSAAAQALAGLPAGDPAYASYSNDISLHYLLLPLLARFTIQFNPLVNYYALLGPSAGWLADAGSELHGAGLVYTDLDARQPLYAKGTGEQHRVSFDNRIPLKDDLQTWSLSGIGAAGVQVNGRYASLFLEARLTVGFTNIYRDPALHGENHTNALALMLGYTVTIK